MFKSTYLLPCVFGLCVATTITVSAAAMPRRGSLEVSALTPTCGGDGDDKKSIAQPTCGGDGDDKKSIAQPTCGGDGDDKKSIAQPT